MWHDQHPMQTCLDPKMLCLVRLQGTLFKYAAGSANVAFLTGVRSLRIVGWKGHAGGGTPGCVARHTQQRLTAPLAGRHRRHVVLVGGLTDGLLFAPYCQALARRLAEASWSLVQPLLSSSHTVGGRVRALGLAACSPLLLSWSTHTAHFVIALPQANRAPAGLWPELFGPRCRGAQPVGTAPQGQLRLRGEAQSTAGRGRGRGGRGGLPGPGFPAARVSPSRV